MSLFKFGTIGMYLHAKNNPRVQATAAIKNGYVFTIENKHAGTGTKSTADVVVGGTPASGTLKISVGGYKADITTTATTTAATATVIYNALTTILTPYGYVVANGTASHVSITAPINGTSISTLEVIIIDAGTSGVTLTPTYTAGTLSGAYAEATDDISSLTATDKYWVALNIVDEAELWNRDDFEVATGGYIRAFELNSIIGYPVEISSDLVTTTYSAVDADGTDYLVPDTSNAFKWVKVDARGNAAVAIQVLEKTTFGGTGFYGKLC